MITINTISDKYFTLDGIQFAKIYQPLAQGLDDISIVNIYDTRNKLENSTKFDEFTVDGSTYASQSLLIEAILPVVWSESETEYNINNQQDEEDITAIDELLKFKDRNQDGLNLGYKIIRKGFDFASIPVEYSDSIWELRYSYDLQGGDLVIPENVILLFNGGVIANYGTITLSGTRIINKGKKIFDISGSIIGTANCDKITPELFGSEADSGNDESEGVIASYYFANLCGSDLYLDSGVYLMNSNLIYEGAVSGIMGIYGRTVLDFSGYSGALNVIQLGGDSFELETYNINSTVSKGDLSIVFDGNHGLSDGDILIIHNPNDYSFSNERSYYKEGEFIEVKEVTGTDTIDLRNSLNADYSKIVGCEIYKCNLNTIKLKNFECIVPEQAIGIRVERGVGVELENLNVHGSNNIQISLWNCYIGEIVSCRVYENNTIVGLNYGVGLTNCQDINIRKINSSVGRHGVAIGGTDTTALAPFNHIAITNRYLDVQDSFLGVALEAGVFSADLHGNTEYCIYQNNTIDGAIGVSGKNIRIRNNIIKTAPDGIAVYSTHFVGGYIDISNNEIICTFPIKEYNIRGVISLDFVTDLIEEGTVTIRDNYINKGDYKGFWLKTLKAGGSDVNLHIINNIVNSIDVVEFSWAYMYLLSSTTVANSYYKKIVISGNEFNGVGISLRSTLYKFMQVTDNVFNKSINRGIITLQNIQVAPGFTESTLIYKGNTFYEVEGLPINAIGQINVNSHLIISDNKFISPNYGNIETSSSQKGYFYAEDFVLVEASNNTIIDYAGYMSRKYWITGTVDESSMFANNYFGVVATLLNNSATKINNGFVNDETVIQSYGVVAPVANYYRVGDRVYNSAPSAAQFMGWVCVIAGTPGTWKGFGLIEA